MKRAGRVGLMLVGLAFVLQGCNVGVVSSETQAKKAEALRRISETGQNRPGRENDGGG